MLCGWAAAYTVHEIWLIDPIWPTLASDLDYQDQGHVIVRQNLKYICLILCSLKLYSSHQNNDYIIYGSRDMADWPLFDQLCQVTLTFKVTWSWDNFKNMFSGFLILLNTIVDIRIMIISSTVYEILLIDHIWPVFSNDLDLQDHVIFRRYQKFVFRIHCTCKPYNRHQNNGSITYSSWDIETYNFWRPSWTPSWFVSLCMGWATSTINFMILLHHTKRLTPTASSHH